MTRAGVAAALLVVAACGVLPDPPDDAGDPTAPVTEQTSTDLSAPPPDSPDGFTVAERAAVRVRNVTCEGLGSGSGFALDEHLLVTNRHVVQGASVLQVSTYDGRDIDVTTSEVATIADLAVVRTADTLPAVATVAAGDPVEGDEVATVGYPGGGPLRTSTGVVRGYTDDPLGENLVRVFYTDAPVEPGSSGSAVVDPDGAIVGVVYAKSDDGLSFAVPVSVVRELLAAPAAFEPPQGCD